MRKDSILFYFLNLLLIPAIAFCMFYLYKNDVDFVSQSDVLLSQKDAKSYCQSQGAVLPTMNELYDLATNHKHPKTLYRYYWSAERYGDNGKGELLNISDFTTVYDNIEAKWGTFCVDDKSNSFAKYGLIAILFLLLGYIWYRHFNSNLEFKYSDIILVALLVGVWLIFELYKLGSQEAPQSFFQSNNATFTIDFGKETEIDKICHYSGIYKGYFDLDKQEQNGTYTNVYRNYEAGGKESYPYSFRWECKNVNLKTSQLKFSTKRAELMIGELKFLSNNTTIERFSIKEYLNVKDLYNIEKLFDEPDQKAITSYYGSFYFDEIYHSRTAYEIIHKLYYYENTHPMLGKILLSAGILMFDMTPFGYRFMNMLFGALIIVLFYLFVKEMFKSRLIGFLGAFLMTFDFMHLTQARIGLIDSFGVFFTILTFYMLYRFLINIKERTAILYLFLTSIAFGLAVGVKWSSFFAISAIGFMILYVYFMERFKKLEVHSSISGYKIVIYSFIALAVAVGIYILTFLPMLLKGETLEAIWRAQINMYDYHSKLDATHPFSSPWWGWPIVYKPMGYVRDFFAQDLKISITAFGNPAIWWFSILSVGYTIYSFIRRRDLNALFILVGISAMYLPYMFIGRIMYIYHFYYAVSIFMLSICYLFNDLIRDKAIKNPKYIYLMYIYMAIVMLLFVMYYPVLSGIVIERDYVENFLIWFKNRWWM